MKTFPTTPAAPVRRDLTDARSSVTTAQQGRKTLLNDRRSTR